MSKYINIILLAILVLSCSDLLAQNEDEKKKAYNDQYLSPENKPKLEDNIQQARGYSLEEMDFFL
jgi:PBP1b-binding outer membrane lipoprotein LpoB